MRSVSVVRIMLVSNVSFANHVQLVTLLMINRFNSAERPRDETYVDPYNTKGGENFDVLMILHPNVGHETLNITM